MELTQEELLADFYYMIEDEAQKERVKHNQNSTSSKLGRLFPTLPIYYHKRIISHIEKRYGGNSEEYIKTIPLFMSLFKREDRNICESNVILEDKKERRKFARLKKETMLWCSHLLGLSNVRTKELYLDNTLFKIYTDIQEQKEKLAKRMRVMNSKGKICKILSPEERDLQKLMQAKRQLLVLDRISEERGDMTWTFLTLTLPPSYHPAPAFGESKFNGCKPSDISDKLGKYWISLRSDLGSNKFRFGVNEDLYGMKVFECHKDGCLHSHILIHHRKKDTEKIYSIIENRRLIELDRYKEECPSYTGDLQWKCELNNGKATATTYVCKYLFPTGEKKGADRNVAARSFYSCRGYDFFGVNECMSMFEFLCANYQQFQPDVVGDEFFEMLKARDLFTFQRHYSVHCKNIKETVEVKNKDDKIEPKDIFLGAEYVDPKTGQTFLYRKKQNALIENFISSDEEIIDLSDEEVEYGLLDMKERAEFNWQLMEEYHCSVVKKQNIFNTALNQYLTKNIGKSVVNTELTKVYYITELSNFYSTYSIDIKLAFEKELESNIEFFKTERKDEFLKEYIPKVVDYQPTLNEMYHVFDLPKPTNYTIIHPYSRKTEKPVPKAPEPWCFEELLY